MSEALLNGIIKESIMTVIKVAGPFLAAGLIIGLIISIIQATTQIQEQTLTFVPKLLGIWYASGVGRRHQEHDGGPVLCPGSGPAPGQGPQGLRRGDADGPAGVHVLCDLCGVLYGWSAVCPAEKLRPH